MDPSTLTPLLQTGLAGLMGYLWLMERRASTDRDRQLSESHAALLSEREKLDILISALDSNTRAITALELGQRRLVDLFDRGTGVPPVSASLRTPGVGAVAPGPNTVDVRNEPRTQ